MVMARNSKSKTATTIAAFVGTTTMQTTSPLQPHYSPTGMRARRRPGALSTGSVWQGIPSLRLVDESRGQFGLLSFRFDNDGNSTAENDTLSDAEPYLPVVTKSATSSIQRDNTSNADMIATGEKSTMATTSVSSNGYMNTKEGDRLFSTPNGGLEEIAEFDQDENRRLAIASEKMMKFLREEAPPTSIILLNLVAIIWGSQHAIIKTVVDDCDPAAFTFLRFGLASVIASPYLPGVKQTVLNRFGTNDDDIEKKNEIDLWTPWRWGLEMGLWMFLGFSLQAIGLQTTTAQRSGFLLYLNVKFVPFFAKVLLGRDISKWTWVSAFAAFSGTALLALDGQSLGLNVGDIWSVIAAAASAMFILRLEKASSEVPNSSELNSTSLATVAILSGAWLLLGSNGPQIASEVTKTAFAHPLELLYLGAISTALANFIQAKAQKDVPAERASIIYSLDPVYGAFFSWIILGETLGGPQAYIGASVIFVAAATNSLLEFSKDEERNE
mmetsp:Transcript_3827/g.9129  ORF Transcript_3827/g.9129 Transcript_3827/m.9129 type:complete len:499 (-) Transcript_3827:2284-3780(-)